MFFLFSDILLYGKPRLLDSLNNSYTCCCVLPLKHCQLETVFGGSKRGAQENTEAGGMFKVFDKVDWQLKDIIGSLEEQVNRSFVAIVFSTY